MRAIINNEPIAMILCCVIYVSKKLISVEFYVISKYLRDLFIKYENSCLIETNITIKTIYPKNDDFFSRPNQL